MKLTIRTALGHALLLGAFGALSTVACSGPAPDAPNEGTVSSDVLQCIPNPPKCPCPAGYHYDGNYACYKNCAPGYVNDTNGTCVLACTLDPNGCTTPTSCPFSPSCPPGQYALVPSPDGTAPNPLKSDSSTLAPAQCSFTPPASCQTTIPVPSGKYYVEPAFTAPIVTSVAVGANAVYAIATKTSAQLAPGEDPTISTALYAWGTNDNYELGDNTTTAHATPVTVLYVPARPADPTTGTPATPANPVVQVVAGDEDACALLKNGTNNVYCWGTVETKPGVVQYTYPMTPWLPTDAAPAVKQITHGQHHACALTSDAVPAVYCWGNNEMGQLGQPPAALAGSEEPVAITGIPATTGTGQLPGQSVGIVQSIAASGNSTCALTAGGYIFCWGDDAVGSLGDNQGNNGPGQPVPQPVPTKQKGGQYIPFNSGSLVGAGSGSEQGNGSFCASYTYAGTLYWECWGANDKGQIDMKPTVTDPTSDFNTGVTAPTDLLTFDSLIASAPAIAIGGHHGCAWGSALSPGLRVAPRCWGSNEGGQLGNTSPSSTAKAPVLASPVNMTTLPTLFTSTPEFDAFAVGGDMTCALYLNSSQNYGTPTAGGNLACWGAGGELVNSNKPALLSWH